MASNKPQPATTPLRVAVAGRYVASSVRRTAQRHVIPPILRKARPVMSAVDASPSAHRDDVLARMGLPLLLLTALAVSLRPGLQSDTYWHMASGRWMVQEVEWLRVDVFSWTITGRPWPRPGLPADIGMYWLYEFGGAPLLVVLTAAIFVAAFLLLFLAVPASPRVMVGIGSAAILASVVSASVRPLVVALPLTAFTAVTLEREQHVDRNRWIWALPVVAAIWVNTHGSFVVLFLLLGCHAAGTLIEYIRRPNRPLQARLSRLAAVAALTVLGTLVNPFDLRMLAYPFEFAAVRVHHESLDEWRQPLLSDASAWPLFIMLAISGYALLRHRKRANTQDLFVVLAFGGLALTAIRHSSVFAIAVYPHVARLLSRDAAVRPSLSWRAMPRSQRRAEVGVFAALLTLTLTLAAPALTSVGNQRATAELMPIQAADAVIDAPASGRLWNSFDVGGYLIWRGTPQTAVSMDSRADLYGDDLVREHIAVWRAERDAADSFRAQGVDTVLVERYAPLVQQLEGAGWTRTADDGLGVVLQAPIAERVARTPVPHDSGP